VSPKSLAVSVKYGNAGVAAAGRRVDFVHIPTLNTIDDAYYAPLRDLAVGDSRTYLGLIHDMNNRARFGERYALAKKYLADFGLSAPCGFGREDPRTLPALLKGHLTALEIANQ